MRLISQNGFVDLPYEQVFVELSLDFVFATFEKRRLCMAQYSDEDEAAHQVWNMQLAYARGNKCYRFQEEVNK